MPAKKHNPPTTFAKIKIGKEFHLNGSWWIKKSSRTAHVWGQPSSWSYFSKDDLVFSDEKESKAHERSQKPRYLNPRSRKNASLPSKDWQYLGKSSTGVKIYQSTNKSPYRFFWSLYELKNGKWAFSGGLERQEWSNDGKGYLLATALKKIAQFDKADEYSVDAYNEDYNNNPRKRKRASDWVLPTVSVEGSKGRWYLEVYAPQGGRTSQSKRSRRVFLKTNDNQSYIKMGKVYKTKAEAQKQRLYLLDQTELYLSMYSSYPDIYSLSQTKRINPRKNTRRRTRRYALQEIAMKKKKR
jgi:hypothetical protein